MMATSDSDLRKRTQRTFLLFLFYIGITAYQLLNRPVTLTDPLSIQNALMAVAFMSLILSVVHLFVFEREVVLTKQLGILALLYFLALTSTLWATSPSAVVANLKFFTLFWVAFAVLVSTVRDRRQVRYWFGFLIFLSVLSIVILTAIILLYLPGRSLSTDFFRSLSFDTNVNIHVIAILSAFPLLLHSFFHYADWRKKVVPLAVFLSGIAMIVFSGSRSPLVVLGVWITGIALFDHTQIGWRGSRQISILLLFGSGLIGSLVLVIDPGLFGRLINQTLVELDYLLEGDLTQKGPLRSRIYLTVLAILTEPANMFLGIGFHNFGTVYADITGHDYYPNPHNPLFKFFTELGILGLVFVLLILLFPFIWLRQGFRSATSSMRQSELAALGSTYVILLIFGVFQPLFGHHQLYISWALIHAMSQKTKSNDSTRK